MKEQAVSKTQKKEKKEKKEKRELTYEEKVKVYDSKELYEDFPFYSLIFGNLLLEKVRQIGVTFQTRNSSFYNIA